jgi:hypothetical protein
MLLKYAFIRSEYILGGTSTTPPLLSFIIMFFLLAILCLIRK